MSLIIRNSSRQLRTRWLELLILIPVLQGCGNSSGESEVVAGSDTSGGSVRPGVILTDTSLGGPREQRPSEALPGPGGMPPAPSLPPPGESLPVPGGVATAPPSSSNQEEGWQSGVARRGGGNAGVAILTQVRSARNDGFDRVVFQFADATVPGYSIEYVDRPVRQCGSGDVVPLLGGAWLSMRLEPAQAHDDRGRATVAQRSLSPGLPNILAITSICDFEGQVEWVAAVRSPTGFRVSELRDPARLVVDVKH